MLGRRRNIKQGAPDVEVGKPGNGPKAGSGLRDVRRGLGEAVEALAEKADVKEQVVGRLADVKGTLAAEVKDTVAEVKGTVAEVKGTVAHRKDDLVDRAKPLVPESVEPMARQVTRNVRRGPLSSLALATLAGGALLLGWVLWRRAGA